MKHLIYKTDDGIAITTPSPERMLELMTDKLDSDGNIIEKGMTEIDAINVIIENDCPKNTTIDLIETENIPTDRYFRNAWAHDNEAVFVDMGKARNIHMNNIRAARNKKLAKLDIEQLKGNNVSEAKQILRDLPQTIDLSIIETPEELKALWPTELL